MQIKFYQTDSKSLLLESGKKDRDLFDSNESFYYNVPFIMANQSGWVLKSPCDFTMEWNGENKSTDMLVHTTMQHAGIFYTGYGNGICSIRTGYVIQTPEEYGILLTAVPNYYKENIHFMTSLIESDWSYTPYYINMKMINLGKVNIKRNEPLGFVTVVAHKQMESFELEVDTILSNPELFKKYQDWMNGNGMQHEKPFRLNRQLRKPLKKIKDEKKT